MKPDISYLLRFDENKVGRVADGLSLFCTEPDQLLIAHAPLYFRLASGAEVGPIQLFITESNQTTTIELWPSTSASGKQCLESEEWRVLLEQTVQEFDGYSLELDHSNGRIESLLVHRC